MIWNLSSVDLLSVYQVLSYIVAMIVVLAWESIVGTSVMRADLILCYKKIFRGLVSLSSDDFLPRFVIVLLADIVLNCFIYL